MRQRADELHSVLVEVEHPGRDDRKHDRHENARQLWKNALEHDDQRNTDETDRERRCHRLAVSDTVDETPRLGDEAVCIHREAEQLRHLPTRIVRARPFM